jgi:hypothetical protein
MMHLRRGEHANARVSVLVVVLFEIETAKGTRVLYPAIAIQKTLVDISRLELQL